MPFAPAPPLPKAHSKQKASLRKVPCLGPEPLLTEGRQIVDADDTVPIEVGFHRTLDFYLVPLLTQRRQVREVDDGVAIQVRPEGVQVLPRHGKQSKGIDPLHAQGMVYAIHLGIERVPGEAVIA